MVIDYIRKVLRNIGVVVNYIKVIAIYIKVAARYFRVLSSDTKVDAYYVLNV